MRQLMTHGRPALELDPPPHGGPAVGFAVAAEHQHLAPVQARSGIEPDDGLGPSRRSVTRDASGETLEGVRWAVTRTCASRPYRVDRT